MAKYAQPPQVLVLVTAGTNMDTLDMNFTVLQLYKSPVKMDGDTMIITICNLYNFYNPKLCVYFTPKDILYIF